MNFESLEQIILFYFFKISPLLASFAYAGSAVVPSQGWFIFGGRGNFLETSQRLRSLDGVWEAGPGKK